MSPESNSNPEQKIPTPDNLERKTESLETNEATVAEDSNRRIKIAVEIIKDTIADEESSLDRIEEIATEADFNVTKTVSEMEQRIAKDKNKLEEYSKEASLIEDVPKIDVVAENNIPSPVQEQNENTEDVSAPEVVQKIANNPEILDANESAGDLEEIKISKEEDVIEEEQSEKAKVCKSCGKEGLGSDKFCGACGNRFEDGASISEQPVDDQIPAEIGNENANEPTQIVASKEIISQEKAGSFESEEEKQKMINLLKTDLEKHLNDESISKWINEDEREGLMGIFQDELGVMDDQKEMESLMSDTVLAIDNEIEERKNVSIEVNKEKAAENNEVSGGEDKVEDASKKDNSSESMGLETIPEDLHGKKLILEKISLNDGSSSAIEVGGQFGGELINAEIKVGKPVLLQEGSELNRTAPVEKITKDTDGSYLIKTSASIYKLKKQE